MRRFVFVKQNSEADCGAACVATVARHYGKNVPLNHVRDLVGTGSQGTTLLGLRRGADELGFHCRALQTNVDTNFFHDVQQITLPAILHWEGNHWVVLHAVSSRQVVIADPGNGILHLNHAEFLQRWGDGVLLTLEPDMARLARQPNEKGHLNFLYRILLLARPYRSLVLRAMLLNAVIGLVGLGIPLLMQVLTDDVLVRRDQQLLAVLGFGMLAIYTFRSVIDFVERKIATYFFERLELSLLLEFGHKLFQMPMKYFDTHRSGDILNRIIEMGRVNTMFNSVLIGLPSEMFLALVSLFIMFIYSHTLALLALPAYVLIVLVSLAFLPRMYFLTGQFIRKSADSQALLIEFFRGAQLLKSTNGGQQAWDEFQSIFGELANLSWRESQLKIISDNLITFLSAFLNISLLVYGSTFVLNRELSIGQLLAFAGLGMNVLAFFRNGSRFAVQVLADRSIFSRLSQVLDAETEQHDSSKMTWVTFRGNEQIAIRNLSFSHPGRKQMIANLSIEIPGGSATALVGGSGSGKSTLMKLISGMYPPASGSIRIGSATISDLSLDCLRHQVCLVTQDSHFFSRSIIENFRFTQPDVSYEDIVDACKITMADDFILDLPAGYQTLLGEFGANLSGGQKQRLAIARAIIGNPPVLIMDESTNALDPALEAKLLDRLLRFRGNRTTIMISHRPSVTARCDFLIYMENGKIKQAGRLKEIDPTGTPGLNRFLPKNLHARRT
ncbi:MAG: peptidase domain-containing ABC transporter [Cyanobacteriota bacterium]|jgi:ABC-type bacteriocin/lantibiotic exporter with double-glycine peptidase domain